MNAYNRRLWDVADYDVDIPLTKESSSKVWGWIEDHFSNEIPWNTYNYWSTEKLIRFARDVLSRQSYEVQFSFCKEFLSMVEMDDDFTNKDAAHESLLEDICIAMGLDFDEVWKEIWR